MEVVLLPFGFCCFVLGAAVIYSELRARLGRMAVLAHVVGWSSRGSSFNSVAQYSAPNSGTYYVESSVGSSIPLHAVGDPVTVFVDPQHPEHAEIKSTFTFVIGAAMMLAGCAALAGFWFLFHVGWYSVAMAFFVIGTMVVRAKKAWDRHPIRWKDLQQYKDKEVVSSRVFSEAQKGQIGWADPAAVASAVASFEKQNRYAVPVLLVFGLSLIFLACFLYGREAAFLGKAARASGQVVGLKASSSSGHSTTYAAMVEYRDDAGRSRRFTDSFSSSPPWYHSGQAVQVLYNPENMAEAQIDRGPTGNYWGPILSGVFGILSSWGCLALFRSRRRTR